MAAPKGNQYWQFAENAGRPIEYTPEELWQKAKDYFDWCLETPWHKNEAIKGGDAAGSIVEIPTAKPFTLKGFALFAGISFQTFENYSKRDEYIEITTRVREICYTQKFEGATVGIFNANIIARELGLAEHKDIKQENIVDAVINVNIVKPKDE